MLSNGRAVLFGVGLERSVRIARLVSSRCRTSEDARVYMGDS